MSKKKYPWDGPLKRKDVRDDAIDKQNSPSKRLKGSVRKYCQPFDPVGLSDWEAIMLEDLTSDTAQADALAKPSLKELGEDPDT